MAFKHLKFHLKALSWRPTYRSAILFLCGGKIEQDRFDLLHQARDLEGSLEASFVAIDPLIMTIQLPGNPIIAATRRILPRMRTRRARIQSLADVAELAGLPFGVGKDSDSDFVPSSSSEDESDSSEEEMPSTAFINFNALTKHLRMRNSNQPIMILWINDLWFNYQAIPHANCQNISGGTKSFIISSVKLDRSKLWDRNGTKRASAVTGCIHQESHRCRSGAEHAFLYSIRI